MYEKLRKYFPNGGFIKPYQFRENKPNPWFLKKECIVFVFYACLIMGPFLELYGITDGDYHFSSDLWFSKEGEVSFLN